MRLLVYCVYVFSVLWCVLVVGWFYCIYGFKCLVMYGVCVRMVFVGSVLLLV